MALISVLAVVADACAQEGIPKEIKTPDHVQSKVGDLDFKDGFPTQETASKLRDELDYINGVNAFMNSIQGVSLYAFRKGLGDVGINDGDFFYTSKMLDSKSLLLTANAERKLDSDGPGQRVVYHPAPVQSAAVFLRQNVAAKRD